MNLKRLKNSVEKKINPPQSNVENKKDSLFDVILREKMRYKKRKEVRGRKMNIKRVSLVKFELS